MFITFPVFTYYCPFTFKNDLKLALLLENVFWAFFPAAVQNIATQSVAHRSIHSLSTETKSKHLGTFIVVFNSYLT